MKIIPHQHLHLSFMVNNISLHFLSLSIIICCPVHCLLLIMYIFLIKKHVTFFFAVLEWMNGFSIHFSVEM